MQLYNQLLFYRHLFDTEKALSEVRGSARYGKSPHSGDPERADTVSEEISALAIANKQTFSALVTAVDNYLDRNGRRFVDMKGLFGFMEKLRL